MKGGAMKRIGILVGLFVMILLSTGCARRVIVYDRPEPPAPKVEIRTASPYPGAVWVPGHWKWRGRGRGYVWVPGHWRRP